MLRLDSAQNVILTKSTFVGKSDIQNGSGLINSLIGELVQVLSKISLLNLRFKNCLTKKYIYIGHLSG